MYKETEKKCPILEMAISSVWLNDWFMIDLYVLIWGEGRQWGMILFYKSDNYVTEVGLWIAVALPFISVHCCPGKMFSAGL